MTSYTRLSETMVQRDDGTCIPADPANPLYQEFLHWEGEGNGASSPVIPLETRIDVRVAAIDARRDHLLKAGKLYGGLHVALLDKKGTDGPRADLSGMATHAGFIMVGIPGLTWPVSYQQGWISVENQRIPLETPASGLMLAAAAGDYFAAVVQCARDKKDACIAAEDQTELDAVSIEGGWPTDTDPLV